jgi:hypothetical protein
VYPTNFTDEYAREKARKLDLDILYSTDRTLLLDLDGEEAFNTFQRQVYLLAQLDIVDFDPDGYKVMRSKSGNYHVIVTLDEDLPIEQRITLQALLGSDLKRELLSLAGWRTGQENPVLLFRPKMKQLAEGEPETVPYPITEEDIPF